MALLIDNGGPPALDFALPQGVSFASAVPEPAAGWMAGVGLVGLVPHRRRRTMRA